MKSFGIPIDDVVELLGLEVNPKTNRNAISYNVKCPFCNDKGYHMNINREKNVYFCPRCMSPNRDKNTGTLDLYSRIRFGKPMIPGRNSKELFKSLCNELESKGLNIANTFNNNVKRSYTEIAPASNKKLNKAYTGLKKLPYLALSSQHKNKMLNRGLTEEAIANDGYFTLPPAQELIKLHPHGEQMLSWFSNNHVCDDLNHFSMSIKDQPEIVAGYLIADDLISQNIFLDHVPGFFKMHNKWCFKYTVGMAIPTKDLDGKITSLQIRKDTVKNKGLRYITVSSKGLPCGVSTKISRTHFALRGQLNPNTMTLLTEGPLKANVIASLLQARGIKDLLVIAIQGVKNTRDIPVIAKYLRQRGIMTIYSALDMDKCTNIHVAEAGKNIRNILAAEGIDFPAICWDTEFANYKYNELANLCRKNNLHIVNANNVFANIHNLAVALTNADIDYDYYIEKGKKIQLHWRDETKGLDDYLLACQDKPLNLFLLTYKPHY